MRAETSAKSSNVAELREEMGVMGVMEKGQGTKRPLDCPGPFFGKNRRYRHDFDGFSASPASFPMFHGSTNELFNVARTKHVKNVKNGITFVPFLDKLAQKASRRLQKPSKPPKTASKWLGRHSGHLLLLNFRLCAVLVVNTYTLWDWLPYT